MVFRLGGWESGSGGMILLFEEVVVEREVLLFDGELSPCGFGRDDDGQIFLQSARRALLQDDVFKVRSSEGVKSQGVVNGAQDFGLAIETNALQYLVQVMRDVEF